MDRIVIGKVVNAVGMKGEIKILDYSGRQERYEEMDGVWIGDDFCAVENVRYQKQSIIIKAAGIDNRDAAEAAKGKEVSIAEDDLEELGEGECYIRDILGFRVVDTDGGEIGTLADIETSAFQDLYCIRPKSGRMIYLPGVREFVLNVDMDSRTITVRLPEGLVES